MESRKRYMVIGCFRPKADSSAASIKTTIVFAGINEARSSHLVSRWLSKRSKVSLMHLDSTHPTL